MLERRFTSSIRSDSSYSLFAPLGQRVFDDLEQVAATQVVVNPRVEQTRSSVHKYCAG